MARKCPKRQQERLPIAKKDNIIVPCPLRTPPPPPHARQKDEAERIYENAALGDSNQRLQLALDAGNLGVWNWNALTDQLILGMRAAQIFGFPAFTPFSREQMRELLCPVDAETAREAWDQSLVAHADYGNEYRLNFSRDGPCWIAMTGRGIYAEDGTVLGMTGVMQDITERKRAESLLSVQKEVLELAANGASINEILHVVIRTVQLHAGEQSLASLFLLEPDGLHLRFAVSVGLSESYTRAVDYFEVGPRSPSCGAANQS